MNKPAGLPGSSGPRTLKVQSHRKTSLNSRVTRSATTIILAAVLGGCGGGGGGGNSQVSQSPVVYPTLSTATLNAANSGVTSNYSKTGNQLTVQAGTVTGSFRTPMLAITVSGIKIGNSNFSEPTFGFSVNLPAMLPLTPSPLDVTSLTPPCTSCLAAGLNSPPDPPTVSFIYRDPASASSALTYSTLGLWSKPSSAVPGSDVGAALSIGVVTAAQDLPISGSATYQGFMVGRYADGTNTFLVGANATAVATFSVSGPSRISSVTFSTSNTWIARELGGALALDVPSPLPVLDLTLTSPSTPLTYDANTNLLSGALKAPAIIGMSGVTKARYYGPPTDSSVTPAEFGGAFFVGNGSEQMNGSFALKKQ